MKVLLSLFLFFIVFTSFAKVRVALFDVPPYSYINEKGDLDGVVYKLCKKIEERSGLKFTYTLVPYARAIKLLKDGEVDLGVFYPSEKYRGEFSALTPTLGNINYLITKKAIKIKSLKEIGSLKIALIRGAKYSKEFDALEKPGQVFVQDYNKSLHMLLLNRVDLVVVSSAAFEYFLRMNNIKSENSFNIFTLNNQKNWIHVSKKMSNTNKEKIKKANTSVIESGNYKSLEDLLQ
ncbi:transporter substrate-binding domain-containing protein [Halobacteriovorax sp. JY17]|uniref:substrate-binding periplasmic protein n=1 Tax=Halobacteriovorax sp. JY17 TaxID=2014617 RepID=UPI000C57091F|nr:transporter substrate-binding domain-containing protein [Halobacteriovorax sp. JY17]PIK13783.1 MAG: hypothetical protein CES88_12400 [Halobacteriovorax sp. JY17]